MAGGADKPKGGKKNRKFGRQKRRQSFMRYWARCFGTINGTRMEFPNRRARHKAVAAARRERVAVRRATKRAQAL